MTYQVVGHLLPTRGPIDSSQKLHARKRSHPFDGWTVPRNSFWKGESITSSLRRNLSGMKRRKVWEF